jgi:Domain of unknown function (DUF5666)
MRGIRIKVVLGIFAASSVLAAGALGQIAPAQSIVSESSGTQPSSVASSTTPAIETAPPNPETSPYTPSIQILPPASAEPSETLIDPASLLPDLPKVPTAKASLIGGTIGRLDRIRDQMTVQVFGGGKMKISFDPRTHIYHDGAEASLADLRQGDRVYVDTILDGSDIFARTIRLKTSTSAGESQGIITSYRADKGELQIHDALSPQAVKVRVTSQTRIIENNHTASTNKLAPGALVSIKFGARQDGGEVAREVSVLASPGDSFTFAGQVTAIDLRLGLLVLTSSTDHKTYEIYLDPSAAGVDDNLRPAAEVTVLTRFQGNRYVARSITVNSQN